MLKDYKMLHASNLPLEQHMEQFADFAQEHFGPVSKEADSFRRRYVAAGFSVVFKSPGLDNDEALKILESPEMQLSLNRRFI